MPTTADALARQLFRAWILYLLGCAACAVLGMLLPRFFPADAAPWELVIYCLLAGLMPGGWYMGGCWFIRQVQEKIIPSSIVGQVLLGAFMLFAPFCFLPMMITGLFRLRRMRNRSA